MLGELLKDISAIKEVIIHPLRSQRSVSTIDKKLVFSTPGLASKWELSFVKNTEEHIYREMMEELDKDDVFFDIGANLGFYTCLMSQEASKVYSFEPNPVAVNLLEKNIGKNSIQNAEVLNVALSDENDSKGFKNLFSESVIGWGSVTEEEGAEKEIEARKAETLFENNRIQLPDIIKIDVEGHEKEVLQGMTGILQKSSPVIYVESHDDHQGLEEIFETNGYRFEKINRRVEGNIFYRAEPE